MPLAWLLQLCLELLFTLVAHNASRAQLLWPTVHDALASVTSPERTTAAGAPRSVLSSRTVFSDGTNNRAATRIRDR